MNCQTTNLSNSFRFQNVETARISNIGLSVAPNNGNRNPTHALDVLGNAVSSGNIQTSCIYVSDKVVITNTSPTMYFKDTNNRSGMMHMNSDKMYFLSGETNSKSWSQVNSQWALYLQTNTNEAVFGGTITAPSYTISSGKPRFIIYHGNFTLPSGVTFLLASGTIAFQCKVNILNGRFLAMVAGIYCATCKLRLPDNNTQSPEIRWYFRDNATNFQTLYENFEMWAPSGIGDRRSCMSQYLNYLAVGHGILIRNDLGTISGCTATFEVFLVQKQILPRISVTGISMVSSSLSSLSSFV
jgi:hypothetical protein